LTIASQQTNADTVDQVLATAVAGQTIYISSIASLQTLIMAPSFNNFLNTLTMIAPNVVESSDPSAFGILPGTINNVQTIETQIGASANPIELKLRILNELTDKKISLLVGLPNSFDISSIDPQLAPLNTLTFKRLALVYSQIHYIETEWDIPISPGVNFLAEIVTDGQVGKLLLGLGKNMNSIVISGTITPTIIGSQLNVGLGGTVAVGSNGSMGTASGLQLVLNLLQLVSGIPTLSIAVQASLDITVPKQENKIALTGQFKYTPPSLLTLSGWMGQGSFYGPPAFGLAGLAIGEFGCDLGTDITEAAATQGAVPFSQLGLAGSVMLGQTKLNLEGEINYSLSPDLVLVGTVNNINVHDIILFGTQVIDTISGHKTQLETIAQQNLPPLAIKTVKVLIIPQETVFLGTYYQQGIEADVLLALCQTDVGMSIRIANDGIQGLGYLSNFSIGPLKITAGPNPLPNTPANAAIIKLDLDPTSAFASLYIEGGIALDVMDGITSAATVLITPAGLTCAIHTKIFTDFEADVIITGMGAISPLAATAIGQTITDITQAANFMVDVSIRQNGLNHFSQILTQQAQDLQNHATQVNTLTQQLATIDQQIDAKNAQIAQLNPLDPKVNILHTEIMNLKIKKENINLEAAAGKWGLPLIAALDTAIATILQNGINITKIEFKASVADLLAGKTPTATLQGTIGGRQVSFSTPLNVKDMTNTTSAILQTALGTNT
jgi:hypothetical protein